MDKNLTNTKLRLQNKKRIRNNTIKARKLINKIGNIMNNYSLETK